MDSSPASYQIIADLLEARTGQHLTESRRWRVPTALSGVFREHGISNVDQLVCLLDLPMRTPGKPDLSQQVVEALLNNETYFSATAQPSNSCRRISCPISPSAVRTPSVSQSGAPDARPGKKCIRSQ